MSRSEDRDLRSPDRFRVGLLQGHVDVPGGPRVDPARGPRYFLRPSLEAFVDRTGALCFLAPGAPDRIVREPDDLDVALVRRLQTGRASAAELADTLRCDLATVEGKLDSLMRAGLALETDAVPVPLAGEDAERFSRQLPYLAELGDDARLQRGLRASSVAVIGCGGLGTWTLAALACVGVGHLVLVDDDHVALSNLNRQVLYARADVGRSKVAAAAGWLRAFDPAIHVTVEDRRIATAADVGPLIAGADAVVLAADSPPYDIARWVNAACVAGRIPFIVAGQLPPLLKIGPTYMPGAGPCFSCHEAELTRSSYAYEDYVTFRRAAGPTDVTTGPGSCIAGGLMALELLHLLTGQTPATRDATVLIHMRTLDVRREPVQRDPACSTCKHLFDG